MATLSITVPNALLPTLVTAADELLDARLIDRTGMTQTQRGQRYIAEILKDVYISRTRVTAETTASSTVATTVATARTDAAGIV